jgi:hypothetical protein
MKSLAKLSTRPRFSLHYLPAGDSVQSYLSNELRFGRLLDFGVIVPRLQQIYEWSAHELGAPDLLCPRCSPDLRLVN